MDTAVIEQIPSTTTILQNAGQSKKQAGIRQSTLFESFGINQPQNDVVVRKPMRVIQQQPYEIPEAELISHLVDNEAIKTWQYPTNRPIRDYQYNIVQTCLFTDTVSFNTSHSFSNGG